jgi:hypothetical protein
MKKLYRLYRRDGGEGIHGTSMVIDPEPTAGRIPRGAATMFAISSSTNCMSAPSLPEEHFARPPISSRTSFFDEIASQGAVGTSVRRCNLDQVHPEDFDKRFRHNL